MKRFLFFNICCLLFLFPYVYGQGITTNSPMTVTQAIDLPNNSWVIINGNIIHALPGGINYTFRDSSGDVTVEIDRRVWRGLNITPSDMIQIQGEISKNSNSVLIKVLAIVTAEVAITRPGRLIFTYTITISEARMLPHDSWLMLIGNIVEAQQSGRHYMFRDSTGEIIVEIDQNVWRGLYIGTSDLVQITGELVALRGQPSFIVRVIRVIRS